MSQSSQYTQILTNIGKHIQLSQDEEKVFLAQFNSKKLLKKDHLQHAGDPCRVISSVNSGILRAYCISPEGKESTIMFAMKDWWITDMHCFVNELPAMMNIQALEDSVVLTLEKRQLDELYVSIPKFERFFRILMQNAYTREQLRTIQNLTLPAENRYQNFLLKYPEISRLITQKQLASYLGITPEFLSAIRAKKS